jgi:hypothetical protein
VNFICDASVLDGSGLLHATSVRIKERERKPLVYS